MRLGRKIGKLISNMDKTLLFFTIFLFLFGLLNIVTSSSREAISYDYSLYHYFFRQGKMLLVGLIGSIIIINIDTRNYKLLIPFLYGIVLCILIYLSLYGVANRGAVNWINLFGFTFQPSEFIKPVLIVLLSLIFEKFYKAFKTKNVDHYKLISLVLIVTFIPAVIIFFQKDLGTMLIIMGIFAVMFLASPILKIEKFKTIIFLLGFGFICILIYTSITDKNLLSEEQLSRLDFFNPCSNYESGGYQVCNAFIAINNGGLVGLGIGKSKQKYSYIPEPHTDSVFSILIEEWGLITGIIVLICYLVILKRILNISSDSSTTRGRYICLGAGIYIFMHILINLGGLFGLIPLTGVPLPFLSYGGSFTISLICMLSVVQRISIENRNKKIKIGGI